MFSEKIKSHQSGLLLYSITPPKAATPPERVAELARQTTMRLAALDIDALVVYDVQDESARTAQARPFPFTNALDPLRFAADQLSGLPVPKIIYRPAGKFSTDELTRWLAELQARQFYPVFVGVPAPDYPVKTDLSDAYQLWRTHQHASVIGAITIPERHEVLKDEPTRMHQKMDYGVAYFISQCVFDLDYAQQLIEDLAHSCRQQQRHPPTLIFTLTACGSAKTLQFMEWLGIHVPPTVKEELTKATDMLTQSVQICLAMAGALITYCTERAIPFGFNIESVSMRKAEVEASIELTNRIGHLLTERGIRN